MDYRARLITEASELLEKKIKLGSFLKSAAVYDLSDINQTLLNEQYEVMRRYYDILQARLAQD